MDPCRFIRLLLVTALAALPLALPAAEASRPVWSPVEGSPGRFRLDRDALAGKLAGTPREFTEAATEKEVVISLPRPDGTSTRFRVQESPVLGPALTAKYGIRTYAARGLDEPAAIARFDLGPGGFHALVLAPSGSVVIRPDEEDRALYRSVRYEDDSLNEATRCAAEEIGLPGPKAASEDPSPRSTAGTVSIYHLATTATGEFTAQNGGTVESALAAITTVINGVNAVYRRDFGIHLELIDETDQVIYTSPSAYLPTQDLVCEGPVNCLAPDCLLSANQCVLDGIIGNANYDVGVVFDATAPGGGAAGRASLYAVCDTFNKGQGATGGTSVELAAHEIGHMFGGHHTFNNNNASTCGNPGQWDAAWAYEPGSGSTVMSYAGTCGWADLQKNRDLAFHSDNQREVLGFVLSGNATACADQAFSGNYGPIVQVPPGDHTIPSRTPFLLTVQAYDPNSDTVTYSFEESDTGTPSPPEEDDGSRPIFRAYAPNTSDSRSMPSATYVLNNANDPPDEIACAGTTCLSGETLATTSRVMDWTVSLRDGVDGVTFTGATITVDGGSGPFEVTQPAAGSFWTEGTSRTVTWSVAWTNVPPVNCAQVRILLSKDGGQTWPHLLAVTANDGAEAVQLPFGATALARIKVEAVGNVFYDVSGGFTIEPLRVTNTNDSGRGSLRQAILDVNSWPTGGTIPLEIPGSGVRTIQVLSQLPTITKTVALDAWEMGGPEYVGPPLLELVGSSCPEVVPGQPCDGLVLQGDNSFLNGLVVRNFAGNGIVIRGAGAYANGIQNCYIGTDATGTTAAGNGRSGVLIDGGYGDPAYGNGLDLNVISGNQVGVTINGASANGNWLIRNKIGLNAAGTARIANLDDGVRIVGAPNTKVGDVNAGNVIAGNGRVSGGFVDRYADGIDVSGAGAAGTKIQGNILGLDAAGTTGIYNTTGNVRITGAPNALIGGTVAGARNVMGDDGSVNYHFAHCLSVEGAGATGAVIQGNYIGTDATGTLDRGCRGAGVYLDGAPGVQIGGTTAAARNVISGNNDYGGIWSANGASGALIQGNYIGTDVTGTLPLGNNPTGVTLRGGGNNTIGGTAAGAGNVISANAQRGVEIAETPTSGTTLQGNLVGTNAAGTAALGNGVYGIFIIRSQNTVIGGTASGARNVISGNVSDGIYIAGGTVGNSCAGTVIQGNYIGTDAGGTTAVGNGMAIHLDYVTDTLIGGAAPGAGNVLSASRAGHGVWHASYGFTTSGVVIQGNRIGTNATGTTPLGNNGDGILASISGTAQILGNLVGGNKQNGINMGQGSFTVKGNAVGTDASGTLDLRNTGSGIYTTSPAPCTIGGTGPGEGNIVAFQSASNTGTNFAGVKVEGGAAGQTIRGNRIFSNTGLGIDLHWSGAAFPNDHCDPDTGGNGVQNFPVLAATNQSGSSTHVTGTLDSTASTAFTVDFYASPSCDSYGFGEGATYLGSTMVATDANCTGSFDVILPVPSSGVVTATATDPSGNTSEFSACAAVGPSPVAEVPGVSWASRTELTWSAAAGATTYRVLRGDRTTLGDLLDTDPDSCTRFTGASLTTGSVLTEDPAAGSPFHWYLVVGSNGVDDGPYGAATSGARIANPSGACP
ncbi:MAG TPA: M12 family metallo-peptidase [Candidatus Polarisedimenticolaceae bacterium]|nr:M12 family metallo-peptidase [Candidatus Polarisedimenticolaceae bacterium]